MPPWLLSIVEKVVLVVVTEVLASHGVTPKQPPTTP